MSRIFLLLILALSPLVHAQAHADEGELARRAIQKTAPTLKMRGFQQSTLPGYYEAMINGAMVYASADGRFLVRGSVEDTLQSRDLTAASLSQARREILAGVGADMRLSFAPPAPHHRITVFTDVDCPFCRRLHAQINEYSKLGIAVDYLFLPLDIHPGADRKAAQVWCSEDRKAAYNAAIVGQNHPAPACATPMAAMREAAVAMGVTATPTAFASDGSLISATVLMSPERLLAQLKLVSDPTPSAP
ncbi:MAG: DsbC family protein [Dokdonella sp.]